MTHEEIFYKYHVTDNEGNPILFKQNALKAMAEAVAAEKEYWENTYKNWYNDRATIAVLLRKMYSESLIPELESFGYVSKEQLSDKEGLIDRLNKIVNDQAIQLAAKDKEIAELKIQLKDEFSSGYDYCKEYYKINDI